MWEEKWNRIWYQFPRAKKIILFAIVSLILLGPVIWLNIASRQSISELECEEVTAKVLGVTEYKQKNGSDFAVIVSMQYEGKEYEMHAGGELSYYENRIGEMVQVFLYNGKLYSKVQNITTPIGAVYYVFLLLDVLSFAFLLYAAIDKGPKPNEDEKKIA